MPSILNFHPTSPRGFGLTHGKLFIILLGGNNYACNMRIAHEYYSNKNKEMRIVPGKIHASVVSTCKKKKELK
jgi:hypothetical protein